MKNNIQVFQTMTMTLSDEELEEAFILMQAERQVRQDRRFSENKEELRKGSIVEWVGTRSGSCTGEVVRVKQKKAIVWQTSAGKHKNTRWDIPMSMLRIVG